MIRECEEEADKVLAKYGMHDVDVKETVGRGEPLFVTCIKCGTSALNAGDRLCVGCRTLQQIKEIAGFK
jgi:hypothetical protein